MSSNEREGGFITIAGIPVENAVRLAEELTQLARDNVISGKTHPEIAFFGTVLAVALKEYAATVLRASVQATDSLTVEGSDDADDNN